MKNATLPSTVFPLADDHRIRPTRLPMIDAYLQPSFPLTALTRASPIPSASTPKYARISLGLRISNVSVLLDLPLEPEWRCAACKKVEVAQDRRAGIFVVDEFVEEEMDADPERP